MSHSTTLKRIITEMMLMRRTRPSGGMPPWPLPNVWVGVSVEDQKRADDRLPVLRRTPAAVRFVSFEPLLGPVTADLTGIHQAICGGESGPGKRPTDLAWHYSLRDQCRAQGVAFYEKQVDKVRPIPPDLMIRQFPATTNRR